MRNSYAGIIRIRFLGQGGHTPNLSQLAPAPRYDGPMGLSGVIIDLFLDLVKNPLSTSFVEIPQKAILFTKMLVIFS